MTGELRLAATAAALALLSQRGLEPGAIDAHAVFGGQLDRQVDREAVGVVQAKGDVAGQDRRVGWQVICAPADRPLGTGQRHQRILEVDCAGVECARELALFRATMAWISARRSARCG